MCVQQAPKKSAQEGRNRGRPEDNSHQETIQPMAEMASRLREERNCPCLYSLTAGTMYPQQGKSAAVK